MDLDRIQRINYTEKIHKIKILIILWKRRNLTPLGKITVIKTLLLPILNHLFISIPNPRKETLKEINDIFCFNSVDRTCKNKTESGNQTVL